jgi:hypothetical protein
MPITTGDQTDGGEVLDQLFEDYDTEVVKEAANGTRVPGSKLPGGGVMTTTLWAIVVRAKIIGDEDDV